MQSMETNKINKGNNACFQLYLFYFCKFKHATNISFVTKSFFKQSLQINPSIHSVALENNHIPQIQH